MPIECQSPKPLRSEDEIVDRLRSREIEDFLGTQLGELACYLSKERLLSLRGTLFKKDATFDDYSKFHKECTREAVTAEMREYMPFALNKAGNHREISAVRSIDHYKAWLWLLGDYPLLEFARADGNYQNYGVPILKRICEAYGFEFPEDEGLKNMAKGLKCEVECEEGCDA